MESATSMDACLEVKSAKQWLNEIASKESAQVKWETHQVNPGCNPPKFVSRCVMSYEVEATGKSKKEAEQEAALLLLQEKLKMTPSSLMALHAPADETDKGEVSETDDFELEEISNPIGELMSMFEKKKLLDVKFLDGDMDGPLHRKLFKVTCTAIMIDGFDVTFTGRRFSKKHAKKIAALRVLREVVSIQGRRGDDLDQEIGGAVGGVGVTFKNVQKASKKGAFNLDEVKKSIEAAARQKRPGVEARMVQRVEQCENSYLTCPKLLTDFRHVFAHVGESQALEKIMGAFHVNEIPEGALVIVEQLSRETGIRLRFSKASSKPPKPVLPYLVVLELMFNVNIGHLAPVTNKKVVHGIGFTEMQAKTNAAKAALVYIRGEPNVGLSTEPIDDTDRFERGLS